MSEAAKTDPCARLDRWLTAYSDDELDAVHVLEAEEHLAACEPCNERVTLDRAVRASLKQTRPLASAALRKRAAEVLLAEHTRHQAEALPEVAQAEALPHAASIDRAASVDPTASVADAEGAPRPVASPRLVKLRYVMPLAVAAGIALVAGGVALRDRRESQVARRAPEETAHAAIQGSTFDRFIDELVDAHMQPPPPEVTDDDGLTRLNPFVGVRVPRPELTSLGAKYLGARMHRREAAMLQYSMGDRRRMTLYVFDPARLPMQANRLQARVLGNNRHVYVGHVRGYAVAASERDGVGYALASDLSDKETEDAIVMAAR